MSGLHPPLTCKDVKGTLKSLGFTYRNTEGSHENWIREEPKPFRKVTVDCPKAPFSQTLIEFMARQAGHVEKAVLRCVPRPLATLTRIIPSPPSGLFCCARSSPPSPSLHPQISVTNCPCARRTKVIDRTITRVIMVSIAAPNPPETAMYRYLIKFDDGATFHVDATDAEEARDNGVELALETLDVIGTVVCVRRVG